MSERVFKVGDRVRITSTRPSDYGVASIDEAPQWVSVMNDMLGRSATICGTDDGPFITVSVDGVGGRWCWLSRDLQLISHEQPTEQPRLPQVGEVWRSRKNLFTVKLEPNIDQESLADGYVFSGHCSDGEIRTFAADGRFLVHDSFSERMSSDIIELVTEAERPAEATTTQPQPTPELEVSVDVVPLDPVTTELHQAIEDPVERFDAINLAVIQDAIAGRRGASQQLIAREVLRFGSLLCRKNNDYGDSAWKPPRLAPGCDAGTAIRVRMSDKLERIESLLTRSQEVKDESIDDTLRDLAAYILLDLARPGRNGVEAK